MRSPGRFFAANQLKLLLAQIVLNYEIEPVDIRPENPWLNNTIGPPMWSTIRVRRRRNTGETLLTEETVKIPSPLAPTKDPRRVPTLLDPRVLQNLASSAREYAGPLTLE
jgi:hypothetical protein